jgi:hypothetical protein
MVRGVPQAVSEERALKKLYQTLNEWKIYPYMSVPKLSVRWPWTEKIGELVLSINSCPSIIILENTFNLLYKKNVVVITSTTGIMFLLVTCMHFCVREVLRRWSACTPAACEVVRDCRKFDKHWSRQYSIRKVQPEWYVLNDVWFYISLFWLRFWMPSACTGRCLLPSLSYSPK